MSYSIKWSEKSKNDFIEIIDYLIDNWGKNSAKKFKNTAINSIELISKMPAIYPSTEYRKNLRRCIVVKQVSMYFQVNESEKEIIIVRFYDNRRNLDNITESLNDKD